MTEGDRPAVDVHLLFVEPEQADARERLRRKGLVELDDSHIRRLQPRLLQRLHRRRHRTDAHVVGVHTGRGRGDEPRERLQVAFTRL